MPKLADQIPLSGNPFQYYTAETEPDISKYAIKPPYMEAISDRARISSSFVLFGDRGAGKSATRITVFEELWKSKSIEDHTASVVPLAINFTEYHTIISAIESRRNVEQAFIEQVGFLVVEKILVWLASLETDARRMFVDTLNDNDKSIVIDMLRIFYLSRPDMERRLSLEQALKVLNQTWTTKSSLWASQRWNELASLIGKISDTILSLKLGKDTGLSKPIEELLKSKDVGPATVSRATLYKIVEFAKIFCFSGVVVLIDKVDETASTQNSADKTSGLVYPILAHVQLLEITGLSWIFFLWSRVKPYLESGNRQVRLDKIANTTIAWDVNFLRQMLDERIRYFSDNKIVFSDLFDVEDFEAVRNEIIETSMKSPRELIRLLDTIVVEHDILYADVVAAPKLDRVSIDIGLDKYVTNVVSVVYDDKMLNQIYRLKSIKFTNRDIQGIFRIKPNSARNKIRTWEDVGIVKQTGTTAAEGDLGGKPSYEYTVIDARVARVVMRNLVEVDDDIEEIGDEEIEK